MALPNHIVQKIDNGNKRLHSVLVEHKQYEQVPPVSLCGQGHLLLNVSVYLCADFYPFKGTI